MLRPGFATTAPPQLFAHSQSRLFMLPPHRTAPAARARPPQSVGRYLAAFLGLGFVGLQVLTYK